MRRFIYKIRMALLPVKQVLLIALVLVFCAVIPILFLLNVASKLRGFGLLVLIAYFALLYLVYSLILRVRERSKLRYMLGEEEYLKSFPDEKKWGKLYDLIERIITTDKTFAIMDPDQKKSPEKRKENTFDK